MSIWQHKLDIWDTAVKAQAAVVELRDQGYIDAATCADECLKLYSMALKETEGEENDDD